MGTQPIAALFFLLVGTLSGQVQQGSSLADVARQARAQKQAQPKAETNQAQQVVDQLAEDQDDKNAPAGFKTYNEGAYKLWVPAPYTMDAHDDGGTVLTGPRVGSKQPLVLVGNPMVSRSGSNDEAFRDAATQFVRGYTQSAHCNKTTVANHNAYQCSLAAANLLGHVVSGTATFLLDSSHIFPVFCVAPTDSWARDILNDPHSTFRSKMTAQRILAQEDEYVRAVWQKCETTFQSIRFEASSARPVGMAESTTTGVGARRADSEKANEPSGGDGTTTVSVKTEAVGTVPAGLKVHSFNYCKSHSRDCWDASILVPAVAQLVSSDCKQFILAVKVQGAPFILLAGTGGADSCEGRSANDPSLVRWNQLAAPETALSPGSASIISSMQASLDGKPAIITTMRFKKGLADWVGKRAEVENNGVQLVVGCMAPSEHFADGDTVCSSVIGSLRLP